MNSNPNTRIITPAYISIGIEFGVRDSTGAMKHSVKDAFLLSKILYREDLETGIVFSPNKSHTPYTLVADSALKSKLYNEGKASCIISFQKRTEGNFAVARLWTEHRAKKTNKTKKEREQE